MPTQKHKTPAELVISVLGVRPLARILGVEPTTVLNWKKKGVVPSEHHVQILQSAAKKITPEELIYGRG